MKCCKLFLLPFILFIIAQAPYVREFYPPVMCEWLPENPFRTGYWRTSIPNEAGPELILVSHNYIDSSELVLCFRRPGSIPPSHRFCASFVDDSLVSDATIPEIIELDDTTYILRMREFNWIAESLFGHFPCSDEYINVFEESGSWEFFIEIWGLRDTVGIPFNSRDPRDFFSPTRFERFAWTSQFDNVGPVAACPSPDSNSIFPSTELLRISVEIADHVPYYFNWSDSCFLTTEIEDMLRGGRAAHHSHPWAIDSTSIIMSVDDDTISWGNPALSFHRGRGHIMPWWSTIELDVGLAGLEFSPGDTVNVCLLDVTDGIKLIGPANHLGTDWHANHGPPIPFCWEFYISPTAVSETQTKPEQLTLAVYPNPANQTVRVEYTVPNQNRVTVTVHDILGRKVETLVDTEKQPGRYSVQWSTEGVSSGVYLISLKSRSTSLTRKTVFLK